MSYNKTGDLCHNITEFGVAEDHMSLQGEGDLLPRQTQWNCYTVYQMKIVLFLYPTV